MRFLFDRLTSRRLLQLLAASTLLFWIALTIVMHIPLEQEVEKPGSGIPKDKTVHFFLYGAFATCLIALLEQRARVFPTRFPTTKIGRYIAVFACCVVHGYLEELTQPWTGRTNDFRDLMTDCIGTSLALAGFYALSLVVPQLRRRGSPA